MKTAQLQLFNRYLMIERMYDNFHTETTNKRYSLHLHVTQSYRESSLV